MAKRVIPRAKKPKTVGPVPVKPKRLSGAALERRRAWTAKLAEKRHELRGRPAREQFLLEAILAPKIKRELVETKVGRRKVKVSVSKPAVSKISQRTWEIRAKNFNFMLGGRIPWP